MAKRNDIKTIKGHPQKNPKSLANLRPIRTHEDAVRIGSMGPAKKERLKEQRRLLMQDIHDVVTAEINVPPALYEQLKAFGVPVNKKERIDKVIFYRSLLKALKDGEADRLIKVADFAGMKGFAEDEQQNTSTMTPDTEMMLSSIFAQGRKVDMRSPAELRSAKAEEEKKEQEKEQAKINNTISVISGLG